MSAQPLSEKAIFKIASSIESIDARDEYLSHVCGDDQLLRDRISTLLRMREEEPDFLEPQPNLAQTINGPAIAEKPGMVIGRYKLVHEIGQGGMGVVYMAVQKEPIKRKVALKIIKPGMETREVVTRFEAERQALALMDHKCIATVLDGGSTESGRPYFVMELVEGTPITEYCDACRFTTQQRLELFIQVCQAVQHAHQKGVIHRDLKPSNILVTNLDDSPVPKVIDFGIAKAVHQQLTDQSLYTHVGQMIGTPLYMSPEQAQGSGHDVDTGTDVYSLGVLLYELLTSVTPFEKERLQGSSSDEVKRIIREEDPPRPSTRLSTLHAAQETVAENHATNLRALSHELSGELDWIVMKALEKDRARRYETASAFSKDVQRYLHDEPVEACPPSTVYRIRKFTRRNKTTVVAVLAVLLALISGLGAAMWQADRATEQAQRADQESQEAIRQKQIAQENFERARAAVDEYLTRVSQEKLLNSPGLQPLRKDLLELALRYYEQFIAEREDDPSLHAELAAAHLRIGKITSQIGSTEEALKAYCKSIEICEKLVAAHPNVLDYQADLARSYDRSGVLQANTGQRIQAVASTQKAIELLEKLAAESPEVLEYQNRLSDAYNNRAKLQRATGKLDETTVSLQKAIDIREKLAADNPTVIKYQNSLADLYANFGLVQADTGEPEEWTASYKKAIDIFQKLAAENPTVLEYQHGLAQAYHNLSALQFGAGMMNEGTASLQHVTDIRETLAAENPAVREYREHLASAYNNLGMLQYRTGHLDEAGVFFQKAIDIREKLVAEHPTILEYHQGLATIYNNFAALQLDSGQRANSAASWQRALDIRKKLATQHPGVVDYQKDLAQTYNNLGGMQRQDGQLDASIASYQKAVDIMEKLAAEHPTVWDYYHLFARASIALGDMLEQIGKRAEAVAPYEKVVTITTAVAEQDRAAAYWGSLGEAQYRLGRWQESHDALKNAIRLCKDTQPRVTFGPRWWYLTMALAQLGDRVKARSYYDQLVAQLEAQENPSEDDKRFRDEAAGLLGITKTPAKEPKGVEEADSTTPNETGYNG